MESLIVRKNNITDAGVAIAAKFIIGNVGLRNVDFSENPAITDASTPVLLDCIRQSILEQVHVQATSIKSSNVFGAVISIRDMLLKNPYTLVLAQRGLNDQDMFYICDILSHFDTSRIQTVK